MLRGVGKHLPFAMFNQMCLWAVASCRREQLRLLKFLLPSRFIDGLKEQLSEEQVGQAFWLLCGLPPFLKLRELRAGKMLSLRFDCRNNMALCLVGWAFQSLNYHGNFRFASNFLLATLGFASHSGKPKWRISWKATQRGLVDAGLTLCWRTSQIWSFCMH